jgi:hypothetical protein
MAERDDSLSDQCPRQDRLSQIERIWGHVPQGIGDTADDILWLLAEVKRLRELDDTIRRCWCKHCRTICDKAGHSAAVTASGLDR